MMTNVFVLFLILIISYATIVSAEPSTSKMKDGKLMLKEWHDDKRQITLSREATGYQVEIIFSKECDRSRGLDKYFNSSDVRMLKNLESEYNEYIINATMLH